MYSVHMYYMYLLMRQCYLQLVVVHHLVADRRQEELLVFLQPWACLVVHGHGHLSLFKKHCEFVLAFRCHNRRVVRAELIQRKLRTDRIHCWPASLPPPLARQDFPVSPSSPGTPAPGGTTGHLTTCLVFFFLLTCVVFSWRPDQLNNGSKWKGGTDLRS